MNSQTIAILFATLLVVAATLIPTYIISKRSATSEDDSDFYGGEGDSGFAWAGWRCCFSGAQVRKYRLLR